MEELVTNKRVSPREPLQQLLLLFSARGGVVYDEARSELDELLGIVSSTSASSWLLENEQIKDRTILWHDMVQLLQLIAQYNDDDTDVEQHHLTLTRVAWRACASLSMQLASPLSDVTTALLISAALLCVRGHVLHVDIMEDCMSVIRRCVEQHPSILSSSVNIARDILASGFDRALSCHKNVQVVDDTLIALTAANARTHVCQWITPGLLRRVIATHHDHTRVLINALLLLGYETNQQHRDDGGDSDHAEEVALQLRVCGDEILTAVGVLKDAAASAHRANPPTLLQHKLSESAIISLRAKSANASVEDKPEHDASFKRRQKALVVNARRDLLEHRTLRDSLATLTPASVYDEMPAPSAAAAATGVTTIVNTIAATTTIASVGNLGTTTKVSVSSAAATASSTTAARLPHASLPGQASIERLQTLCARHLPIVYASLGVMRRLVRNHKNNNMKNDHVGDCDSDQQQQDVVETVLQYVLNVLNHSVMGFDEVIVAQALETLTVTCARLSPLLSSPSASQSPLSHERLETMVDTMHRIALRFITSATVYTPLITCITAWVTAYHHHHHHHRARRHSTNTNEDDDDEKAEAEEAADRVRRSTHSMSALTTTGVPVVLEQWYTSFDSSSSSSSSGEEYVCRLPRIHETMVRNVLPVIMKHAIPFIRSHAMIANRMLDFTMMCCSLSSELAVDVIEAGGYEIVCELLDTFSTPTAATTPTPTPTPAAAATTTTTPSSSSSSPMLHKQDSSSTLQPPSSAPPSTASSQSSTPRHARSMTIDPSHGPSPWTSSSRLSHTNSNTTLSVAPGEVIMDDDVTVSITTTTITTAATTTAATAAKTAPTTPSNNNNNKHFVRPLPRHSPRAQQQQQQQQQLYTSSYALKCTLTLLARMADVACNQTRCTLLLVTSASARMCWKVIECCMTDDDVVLAALRALSKLTDLPSLLDWSQVSTNDPTLAFRAHRHSRDQLLMDRNVGLRPYMTVVEDVAKLLTGHSGASNLRAVQRALHQQKGRKNTIVLALASCSFRSPAPLSTYDMLNKRSPSLQTPSRKHLRSQTMSGAADFNINNNNNNNGGGMTTTDISRYRAQTTLMVAPASSLESPSMEDTRALSPSSDPEASTTPPEESAMRTSATMSPFEWNGSDPTAAVATNDHDDRCSSTSPTHNNSNNKNKTSAFDFNQKPPPPPPLDGNGEQLNIVSRLAVASSRFVLSYIRALCTAISLREPTVSGPPSDASAAVDYALFLSLAPQSSFTIDPTLPAQSVYALADILECVMQYVEKCRDEGGAENKHVVKLLNTLKLEILGAIDGLLLLCLNTLHMHAHEQQFIRRAVAYFRTKVVATAHDGQWRLLLEHRYELHFLQERYRKLVSAVHRSQSSSSDVISAAQDRHQKQKEAVRLALATSTMLMLPLPAQIGSREHTPAIMAMRHVIVGGAYDDYDDDGNVNTKVRVVNNDMWRGQQCITMIPDNATVVSIIKHLEEHDDDDDDDNNHVHNNNNNDDGENGGDDARRVPLLRRAASFQSVAHGTPHKIPVVIRASEDDATTNDTSHPTTNKRYGGGGGGVGTPAPRRWGQRSSSSMRLMMSPSVMSSDEDLRLSSAIIPEDVDNHGDDDLLLDNNNNEEVWSKLLTEAEQQTADSCCDYLRQAIAGKRLMSRACIPTVHRARAWLIFSGGYEERRKWPKNYYRKLVRFVDGTNEDYSPPLIWREEIRKDIHRTLPDEPLFQTTEGKAALERVLSTWVLRNPNLGYCQGMNLIAATCLTQMNEEDAFWVLVSLIESRAGYYNRSMCGLKVDQRVLDDLVAFTEPRIADHFQRLEVSLSMFTVSWFLCLFVESPLPAADATCVWDHLFAEGESMLFAIALSMLRMQRDAILAMQSGDELLDYFLHGRVGRDLDVGRMLQDASTMHTMPACSAATAAMEQVDALRHYHRHVILEESQVKDSSAATHVASKFHFDSEEQVQRMWRQFLSPSPWDILLLGGIGGDARVMWFHRAFCPIAYPPWHRRQWRDRGIFAGVIERMFDVLDSSCIGQVSFDEFCTGIYICCRGSRQERLALAYRFCDLDNDGKISLTDLTEAYTMLHEMYCGASDDGVARRDAELFSRDAFDKALRLGTEESVLRYEAEWNDDDDSNKYLDFNQFCFVADAHPFVCLFFGIDQFMTGAQALTAYFRDQQQQQSLSTSPSSPSASLAQALQVNDTFQDFRVTLN